MLATVFAAPGAAEEPIGSGMGSLTFTVPSERQPETSAGLAPGTATGAATYVVPLGGPPAHETSTPELALVYDSHRGGGLAGKGWDLNLSRITINPAYGSDRLQLSTITETPFLLDDVELLPDPRLPAGGRRVDRFGCDSMLFRTEPHNDERILYCPSADYWTATDTRGTTRSYGRLRQMKSRFRAAPSEDTTNHTYRTYEYYLDEVRDRLDLAWRVEYELFGDAGNDQTVDPAATLSVALPHPVALTYTYAGSQIAGPTRRIRLEWETMPHLASVESHLLYGFSVHRDQRLSRVIAEIVNAGQVQRYRSYVLNYDADPTADGEQFSPDSGAVMLASIESLGTDGTTQLPRIEFTYGFNVKPEHFDIDAKEPPGFAEDVSGQMIPLISTDPQSAGVEYQRSFSWSTDVQPDGGRVVINETHGDQGLFDMNGDGYIDFYLFEPRNSALEPPDDPSASTDYTQYVYLGGPDGFSTDRQAWEGIAGSHEYGYSKSKMYLGELDAGFPTYEPVREMLDMNGDARPDMVAFEAFRDGTVDSEIALNTRRDGSGFEWNPSSHYGNGAYEWDWAGAEPAGRTRSLHKIGPFASTSVAELISIDSDRCPDRIVHGTDQRWYVQYSRLCDRPGQLGFHSQVELQLPTDAPARTGLRLQRQLRTSGKQKTYDTIVQSDLADLNGDGLVDSLVATPSGIRVMLGTGRGFVDETVTSFGPSISTLAVLDKVNLSAISPGTATEIKYFSQSSRVVSDRSLSPERRQVRGQRQALIDMNGDGLVDIVKAGSYHGHWRVFLNRGDRFEIKPIFWEVPYLDPDHGRSYIQASAPTSQPDAGLATLWRLSDVDGNGLQDLVRRSPFAIHVDRNAFAHRPDLLVKVEKGVYLRTELEYSTITTQEGASSIGRGNMALAWTVLSNIKETHRRASYRLQSTRSYRYHDGFFDTMTQRFLGFGRVEVQVGSGAGADGEGPVTRVEEHVFHNGDSDRDIIDPHSGRSWPDSRLLAGKLAILRRGVPGVPPSEETYRRWEVAALAGAWHEPKAARLVQERDYSLDGSMRARQVDYTYDRYGNVKESSDQGEVKVSSNGVVDSTYRDDELHTKVLYAHSDLGGANLHAFPRTVWVCSDPASCTGDPLRRTDFAYDGAEFWLTQSLEQGNVTGVRELVRYPGEVDRWAASSFRYDDYGNVVWMRDPVGSVVTRSYDDASGRAFLSGEQTSVAGPSVGHPAASVATSFAPSMLDGAIDAEVTATGRLLVYERDALGRVLSVRSSQPDQYHSPNDDPSLDADDVPVLLVENQYYSHDAKRERNFTTGEDSYIDTYTRTDGDGRPIVRSISSGGGLWTSRVRAFDHDGLVVGEMLPFSSANPHFIGFNPSAGARSDADILVVERDWAGREVRRATKGRLANGDGHDFGVVETSYFGWSRTQALVGPPTRTTTFHFDAAGRPVLVEELDGSEVFGVSVNDYDLLGDRVSQTDQDGNVKTATFDSRGLRRTLVDPNSSNCADPSQCPTRYSYDLTGHLEATTEASGDLVEQQRDELGRVITRTRCGADRSEFEYGHDEGEEALLIREEREGIVRELDYDHWGRVVAELLTTRVEVGGSLETRSYRTGWEYDLLDRPTRIIYPKPHDAVLASQKDLPSGLAAAMLGTGVVWVVVAVLLLGGTPRRGVAVVVVAALTACACTSCSCTGEFESEIPSAPSVPGPFEDDSLVVHYGDSIVGKNVYWASDDPATAPSQWVAWDLSYSPIHRLASIHWGSPELGMESTIDYWGAKGLGNHENGLPGSVARIRLDRASGTGSATLRDHQYQYNPAGELESVSEPAAGRTTEFGYDYAGRLSSADVSHANGEATAHTYGYSPAGNLERHDRSNSRGNLTLANYRYGVASGPHAVSSVTEMTSITGEGGSLALFEYDANGRMKSGLGNRYEYSCGGELAAVPSQDVTYRYGASGERVESKWGPSTQRSETRLQVGPHLEVVLGQDGSETHERHVMVGGRRLAVIRDGPDGSETVFMHLDHLSSVAAVAWSNGNSAPVAYGPYGLPYDTNGASTPVPRYGFTGAETLFGDGHVLQMAARMYAPSIGRMMAPDSLDDDPLKPQSINRYSYALDNPIRYTDPSGYTAEDALTPNPSVQLDESSSAVGEGPDLTGALGVPPLRLGTDFSPLATTTHSIHVQLGFMARSFVGAGKQASLTLNDKGWQFETEIYAGLTGAAIIVGREYRQSGYLGGKLSLSSLSLTVKYGGTTGLQSTLKVTAFAGRIGAGETYGKELGVALDPRTGDVSLVYDTYTGLDRTTHTWKLGNLYDALLREQSP